MTVSVQRAFDGKEALQRQLAAAKGSGSSAGGGDQSVLSLMMQVEDLKSKVDARFVAREFLTLVAHLKSEKVLHCCFFDAFLRSSRLPAATRRRRRSTASC